MKSNAEIYNDVMDKLHYEASIDASNITVSVDKGVVTLAGFVNNYAHKLNAERAVRTIEGVYGVANELKVNLLAKFQKSDADIAKTAIDTLDWNINVPHETIKVTVDDGHVTLTGIVDYAFQRESAEKAIRNLVGVKSLNNQIRISRAIKSAAIKDLITKEFKRNAAIDAKNIHVDTNGSKVTLKGFVRSWVELQEASRAAWSALGVDQVDNQLVIDFSQKQFSS